MTQLVERPVTTSPGHGSAFTSHMVSMCWTEDAGWHDARLLPLDHIPMHPAMIGLHYGQVIFEGMKAHRRVDGSMAVFRPRENAKRFQRSARRLAMPELPAGDFIRSVERLVAADHAELSDNPDHSLYLRPLMFATEPNLMLRPSTHYQYLLMAFVAGGFFGDTLDAVSVWVSREHSRAMPGGTGDVKCAANYGPSFLAQRFAQQAGCQQVVWLDSIERRWVEELGGMNLFFVRGSGPGAEVVTPTLTGTMLPGVTRDSLLVLARRLGYSPAEQRICIDQWREECAAGRITEVFACGTAAVVTPVGRVRDTAGDWTIGDGNAGPVTLRLRSHLLDLQHGLAADPDGWMHPVCKSTPRGSWSASTWRSLVAVAPPANPPDRALPLRDRAAKHPG
jgi:branched-chain amino acid aminotransferase